MKLLLQNRRWLFFLILTGLVLSSGQAWTRSWSTNRQGRETLHACFSPEAPVEQAAETIHEAWFRAIMAQCAGDAAATQDAWQQSLAESPRYVPLVRAVAPDDLTLAIFAVEQYPDQAEAHIWLGDALVEAAQPAAAVVAYEQGLALDPTQGLTWRVLGDLYREQGADWQTIVHAYDQACHYVDQGKNGCLRAGALYMEQGMYIQAADRYHTSLQQLPGYHPAIRGYAQALLAMENTQEALPFLQTLANGGDTWAQEQLRQLAPDQ